VTQMKKTKKPAPKKATKPALKKATKLSEKDLKKISGGAGPRVAPRVRDDSI